jgi:hypothetical protein
MAGWLAPHGSLPRPKSDTSLVVRPFLSFFFLPLVMLQYFRD